MALFARSDIMTVAIPVTNGSPLSGKREAGDVGELA